MPSPTDTTDAAHTDRVNLDCRHWLELTGKLNDKRRKSKKGNVVTFRTTSSTSCNSISYWVRLRGLNASGQQTGIREFLLENTCSWQEQEVTVQLSELGAGTVQLQWELYNPSSDDKLYIDELELLSLQVMQEECRARPRYYSYGLTMAGVGSLPSAADHHYLYQGKELENDFDLAWRDGASYRFHARAFDAQRGGHPLGKWHVHDPAYQFASPYVGMGNNPVVGVDPDGRAFFTTAVIVATLVSAAIGGTMNVVDNWDNIQSGGNFAAAFTIGAVGGAAAAIATAAVIASGGTALTFGAAALAGATGGGVGALVGDGLTQLGNLAYFGTPFQWDRLGSAITYGIAIGAASGVLGHWLGKGSGPKPGNSTGKSNTLTPLDQSKMRPMPQARMLEMPAKTPTLDFFPKPPRAGIPTKGISLRPKELRVVVEGAGKMNPRGAFYLTRHCELTDGVYKVSKELMKKHVVGGFQGRSVFYPTLDAEEAVLKAARYADEAGLWINNRAKVPVLNTNIGTTGLSSPTNYINVYRNNNGFIHGTPGNIR